MNIRRESARRFLRLGHWYAWFAAVCGGLDTCIATPENRGQGWSLCAAALIIVFCCCLYEALAVESHE